MTRTRNLLLATVVVLGPPSLAAQERPQAQLMLSIFGGLTASSALWEVNRQPLSVLNTTAGFDSLRLVRRLGSSIMAGASGTYFPSRNLGIYGEITFLGLGIDDQCTAVFIDPTPVNTGLNRQVCDDITTTGGAATTVGFFAGATYRIAPRAFASPYVRIQGGVTTRSSSTTEVVGRFIDAASGLPIGRVVIADPDGGKISPSFGAALGVMIPVASGYQVRFELRDHLLFVQRVDGPASTQAIAPTSTITVHNLALSVGLDIVLERRRGRRY